jgi:hypothetical protein
MLRFATIRLKLKTGFSPIRSIYWPCKKLIMHEISHVCDKLCVKSCNDSSRRTYVHYYWHVYVIQSSDCDVIFTETFPLSLSLSLKLSGTLIIHKTPSKLAPYEFKLRSKPSSVLENLLFKIIFVVKILADPKLAMHVSSFHKVCWNCAGFQFIPPVLYQAHLDRRQKRKDPERYIHCVSQRNSMALG